MTSIEFAYWLQGYFEIAGTTNLSKDQCAIIAARLEKVTPETGASSNAIERFIATAKQDISRLGRSLSTYGESPTRCHDFGRRLSAQLNNVFEHDIDPTYNGDQTHFNSIHKFGKNEPGARC